MAITNYKDRMAAEELAKSTARWDAALKAGYKPSDYGYDKHGNKTSEYTGFKLPEKRRKKTKTKTKAEEPEEELTQKELLEEEVFRRARRDARIEDEKKQRDAMLNSDTPPGGSKPASEDAVNPYRTKRLEKEAKSASWETTPSPTHGRPSIWNADTGKWEDVSSRPPEGREVKTDSGNWYIPSGNTFRKNEARKAREAKDLKHEQNFDDWAEVQRAKREKEAAESKSPKPMGTAEITPGEKKPTPETTPDTTPDMGDDPLDDAAGRAIRAAATVGLGTKTHATSKALAQKKLRVETEALKKANRQRLAQEKDFNQKNKAAQNKVKVSNAADKELNRAVRHGEKVAKEIIPPQARSIEEAQKRQRKLAQRLQNALDKAKQAAVNKDPIDAKKWGIKVLQLTRAATGQAKIVEDLKSGAARGAAGFKKIAEKADALKLASDKAKGPAKIALEAAKNSRGKADAAKAAVDSARKNAANIIKGGRAAGVGAAVVKPLEALGKLPGAKLTGKVLSKAAVPLEVGMMAYEGAQLMDKDHREARQKEFDKYADTGVLRSTYESAMNPIAGIYTAANRLNEWSMAYGAAKKSASAYEKAKFKSDKFKAALEAAGLTDPPEGAGSLDYGERKKEGSTPEQDEIIRQWRAARKKVRDVVYAS